MDPESNINSRKSNRQEVVAPIGTIEKRATTVIIVVPLAAIFVAAFLAWGGWFFWHDVVIMAVMYFLTVCGVTVGFHRFFTHRSFDARKSVKAILAVLGSMAIEGALIDWVADHRRHHKHSDREGDPHSPHQGFEDHVIKGLIHAHFGWLVKEGKTNRDRFAPDLVKDPMISWIDRSFLWLWLPLTFAVPALAGLAITGTFQGMMLSLLWGGLVRIFLVHHVTWSINSICHMFGRHEYESKDHSTNVPSLAPFSLGESFHNGHHAFPVSAHHGMKPWERAFDLSWQIIRLMERLGLAWNVKRTPKESYDAKRIVAD
jgi:stearoyl-CoA desaturase (delta-9 desaturase)